MNTAASTEVHAPAYATAVSATPYEWPWHGSLDPAALALVVLRQRRWRPLESVDDVLVSLAEAVHRAGGVVLVAGDDEELPPFAADLFVRTRATSAFHQSSLDGALRQAGRCDLLLAGWGLESAVHSTMRAANDRGYECLLVEDACTALHPALVAPALSMVMHSGGIFGAHAPAGEVLSALGSLASSSSPPSFDSDDKEHTNE